MKSRNSGFTLIELMIVAAIIVILASVLIPAFSSDEPDLGQPSPLKPNTSVQNL